MHHNFEQLTGTMDEEEALMPGGTGGMRPSLAMIPTTGRMWSGLVGRRNRQSRLAGETGDGKSGSIPCQT